MITPPLPLRYQTTLVIDDSLTVPHLPPVLKTMADMPPVFATAYMVALVETACIEALKPYLEPGEVTLGIDIDMRHSAATPTGVAVTTEIVLEIVEGRKLRFTAQCHDGHDVIGHGRHERALVQRDRFIARTMAKRGAA